MPINITTPHAIEESTYIVTAAFTDAAGDSVTPNEAWWTLTDEDGTVINSRLEVEIASLADSVDIVLTGDDLALPGGANTRRIITIEGTYDSDEGIGLPVKEQATFQVDNLVKNPLK